MFQDIRPHEFHNQFSPRKAKEDDYLILYKNNKVLLLKSGEEVRMPQYRELRQLCPSAGESLIYLLSVDDTAFYLSWQEVEETDTASYYGILQFRGMQPEWLAFSGATAFHLARWYDSHRFCGRCSSAMSHKETERAVYCPACGQEEYPKISPVIIVGIKDEKRLLLTKYAKGYRRHTLVAGFMEVGETLEDTVRREVMEEVGLKVKNIRYYKSQPWAFSESILVGFFADVDGSCQIHLDETELSEGEWFEREKLPSEDTTMSLTWDMIESFRTGVV